MRFAGTSCSGARALPLPEPTASGAGLVWRGRALVTVRSSA